MCSQRRISTPPDPNAELVRTTDEQTTQTSGPQLTLSTCVTCTIVSFLPHFHTPTPLKHDFPSFRFLVPDQSLQTPENQLSLLHSFGRSGQNLATPPVSEITPSHLILLFHKMQTFCFLSSVKGIGWVFGGLQHVNITFSTYFSPGSIYPRSPAPRSRMYTGASVITTQPEIL